VVSRLEAALGLVALAACHSARGEPGESAPLPAAIAADLDAGARLGSVEAASPQPAPVPTRDAVGPFEAPMLPGRTVWYALPRALGEHRLVAHLHGQCAPPVYSCGQWLDAGTEHGLMVCPTGNEHCTSPIGPAMWDESFTLMDQDLERGIAVVQRRVDGGIARDDEVLTGFSRGGWAAIEIVGMHPGRWPHLILVEADVTITKAILDRAKVRSVALIAGELGTELPGEKKSVEDLQAQGFPATLLVMPKTAHLYSTNIDALMRQALDFVLSH
jgi:hypothetical protein